jgi:hypothetical protein
MGGTEKQDELGERGSIGFLYLNIGLQVRCPEVDIVGVRPSIGFTHSFVQILSFSVPVVSDNHHMKNEYCFSEFTFLST